MWQIILGGAVAKLLKDNIRSVFLMFFFLVYQMIGEDGQKKRERNYTQIYN